MDGQLAIQDIDIQIALGISMGPRVVDEAVFDDKSEDFSSEVEKWKLQFEKEKKIESKDILAKMKTQRDGGEDFKRNFIVYIVSRFLGGVKSSIVSLKVLKCLGNVAEIPLYNWCEFTKKKLVDNIILWQKEEVRRDIAKENVFKGPIMMLVYIYLDRVVFKLRTIPRTFLTICSWSKESISDRIKQEKKFTKTFRKGFVDCQMVIKEEHADDKPATSSRHETKHEEKVEQAEQCDAKAKMCVEKLVFDAKKLASSFDEFKVTANDAIHELPDSLAISKMVFIADVMVGGFVSSQNDENNGPEEPEHKNVGNEKPKDLWDDDAFWGNEKILEALFALNDALQPLPAAKQNANKRKKFAYRNFIEPEVKQNVEAAATVGLHTNLHTVEAAATAGLHIVGCQAMPTDVQKKVHNPPQHSPQFIHSEKASPSDAFHTPENQPISIIIESTPPPSADEFRQSPLATLSPEENYNQIPKRDRDVAAVYKSPYLQRNMDVLSDLTMAEKEVADYVFSDSVYQR
ncbi:hypothetical protein RND81_01G099400 [Saponaria officinalis]|uniref:Uncharacterized protein n=1 Tax=Saponaria officinalis TaxID=3572 RepID=A0AAW1N9B4_SAPOF